MSAVWNWLKKEAVLAIAALCALVSALFVPPSLAYVDYLDLRVLCLLFCLMVVVAGFRSLGVFSVLAQRLLGGRRRLRVLVLLLVFLPFFFSMFITNDVALIAFVPFALLTLGLAGSRRYLLRVVVLQTIAANLGSMLTPFGNPQNLYLYSYYQMSIGDFFGALGLYTLASLVLLALCCLFFPNKTLELSFSQKASISSPLDVWLFLALFLVCLVSVLRLVHYLVPLALVVLGGSFAIGSVKGNLRPLTIGLVGRLLVMPALFLPFGVLLGFRGPELLGLMVMLGAPTAVSSYTMAQQMGGDSELAGELVVFGTMLSVITIFLWTFLLKSLGYL